MVEVEFGLVPQMAVCDALEISKKYWKSERVRNDRRLAGFMGECAASIFLTNSIQAWTNGFENWKDGNEHPDLHDFPDIEVKTLAKPSHRLVPLNGPSQTHIKKCEGFLVMQFIEGIRIGCAGWIDRSDAERKYFERPRHMPSGTPAITVEELDSAETCPWLRRQLDATR